MAGGRKAARQWAMQMLYQLDINPEETATVFGDFFSDKQYTPNERKFAEETVSGVLENLHEIDSKLSEFTGKWDVHRLAGVERNSMRIAMFEMLYRDDIPPVVSINEAIEIAKDYSGEQSGRYVNGILDEIRKTLGRAARSTWKPLSERLKDAAEDS